MSKIVKVSTVRRGRRRGPTKLNARQKVQVKRLIGNQQELKYFPLYAGYTAVNASGALTKWSGVSQGDTVINRDGAEIHFREIDLRFNVFPTAAAVMTGNAFRIIVFQWKPDDAVSTPGMSTILDSSFTQPCFSPTRYETRQQFRVLFDRLYRVYNGGPGCAGAHVHLRKAAKRIRFTGATTGTNMIYVLVISDAAVQTPSWSYGGYLRFTDS